MSYDLELWSIRPAESGLFSAVEGWHPTADCWSLEQRHGMIQVWKSDKVWSEDIIRGDIDRALPGIAFLTRITVSGKLTDALLNHANKIGKRLATACHGVVFDPQEETLSTPTGVKPVLPEPPRFAFAITQLSWWTLDGAAFGRDGISEFVTLFERLLPEALPRRYGLYEPPQHVFAETGHEHFLEFLNDHIDDVIVWYPTRPVLSVSLQLSVPVGPTARGFRTHHVSVAVEASVLGQPGWQTRLRRVWRELSKLVRPFYGDVRTLAGYHRHGGSLMIAQGTEMHPASMYGWRGIPALPASAVVLGVEYQRLWPDFVAASGLEDGLAFLDGLDWDRPARYSVPAGLVKHDPPPAVGLPPPKPSEADRRTYSDVWPFDGPFSPA